MGQSYLERRRLWADYVNRWLLFKVEMGCLELIGQ